MSVEYYYVNDLNRLYNAAVGDKTDGDEHHVRMIEAHDNLKAYVQKLEHWKDTALQLSRNNGEAQAKIKALEADYVISNRELLIKQVEIARLTAELAELRERTRWIPVSERLPEDDYLVNVAFLYKNKIRTTSASHNNYGWYFDMEISGPTMLEDVTHWMPLPEPPEADDADN